MDPKPFRSLDVWLTDPRFKPFLKDVWDQLGGASLPTKLKGLKCAIKKWNKSQFDHIETKVTLLEKEMDMLDSKGDRRVLNDAQLCRKATFESNLHKWRTKKA